MEFILVSSLPASENDIDGPNWMLADGPINGAKRVKVRAGTSVIFKVHVEVSPSGSKVMLTE